MSFAITSIAPAAVAAFVGARTGADFGIAPYSAIGLLRSDEGGRAALVGGAVFNLFDPPDISVSVAIDPAGRPGVRRLLAACRRYAFEQLGCRRVSASIHALNHASLSGAKRAGFGVEGVKRRAAADGADIIMLGLLQEDI